MRQMLTDAGFTGINIEVKENAAEIISGWMPGSGAEKYITSCYVTARKSQDCEQLQQSCCAPPCDIADLDEPQPDGPDAGC